MNSREDFEQWYRAVTGREICSRYLGGYADPVTDTRWETWTAACQYKDEQIATVEAQRDKALSDIQEMVAKAASEHRPAYDEQQKRIMEMEARIADLATKLRYEQGCRREAIDRVRELEAQRTETTLGDVKAWADGIQGDLGTENANRVTDEEARLSWLILHGEAQRVPEIGRYSDCPYEYMRSGEKFSWVTGWNDCRRTMLSAAPPAPTGDE